MPMLSRVDVLNKNLCLKKRRELINNGVPPDKLKIPIFEPLNNGKNVVLIDQNEKTDWLFYMNMLLLKTRRLRKAERRENFLNAIIFSLYNVLCLCETCLDGGVSDSELKLKEYKHYRADRLYTEDHRLTANTEMKLQILNKYSTLY